MGPGNDGKSMRNRGNSGLLNALAETDRTFSRAGGSWVGKCLICGGPLRFDAGTGEGATVEHILPRSLGGGNELLNLGIAHARCNSEKGRRWDPRRQHRADPTRYVALVERLLAERQRRWREPTGGEKEAAHP
jgi:5-methylcytosine-specific restriction endonuclease McrA